MKRATKRMWTLFLTPILVLALGGGVLAAGSMPGMNMTPTTPAPGAPAAPAAITPASGEVDLAPFGLTPDQISALKPLIAQARKTEQTKQDELGKLKADRAQAASQPNPDQKKVTSLDKLIQIKQGEITVARGQAQIAFAKVVGDAKAKAVADRVFAAPAAQAGVNRDEWLDQMNQYMDQMLKQIPELSKKNPDEALKLMNEMVKLMGQMTNMRQGGQRGGMMGPAAAPVPTPAPAPGNAADPNASSTSGGMGMMGMMGMEKGMGMGDKGMQQGKDMMQKDLEMDKQELQTMQQMMQQMQQMMKMMPMNSDPNNGGMNMGGSTDPNANPNGGMSGGMPPMPMM